MASYKTKRMWKNIGIAALVMALFTGILAGIHAIAKVADDGYDKVNLTYSVGGLNETGKYEKADNTLYTKNGFDCEGKIISADLDFDTSITYELFFYDKDDNFVSKSGVISSDYKEEVDENVVKCRIEITPVWDEDVDDEDKVVKWYNKLTFTTQLKISVKDIPQTENAA